jgi:maleamate amidohydrolase
MVTDRDALASVYAASGLGSPMAIRGPAALVLVDVQRGFFEELYVLGSDFGALADRMSRLVDLARGVGLPVAFTRVSYRADFGDAGVFGEKIPDLRIFCEGEDAREIAGFVAPRPEDGIFDKQQPSGFFGTDLAPWLRSRGVVTALIAGVTTSGCVRATAVDAMSHGFLPVVVSDAVGDRHQMPHDAALFDISAKYGVVATTDELIAAGGPLHPGPDRGEVPL